MPTPFWFDALLLTIHLLSVAAWFGALIYRTFVVDVRSRVYFDGRDRDYEDFQLVLTHGARYVVLAALLVGGLSGVLLAALRWSHISEPVWFGVVAAKSVVYLLLFTGFVYISWWLWPRRNLATANEIAREQKHARFVALAMLGLLTVGMLLGVAARVSPAGLVNPVQTARR